MVTTGVCITRTITGVLGTKRPTQTRTRTRTQSPFNFLSFISIDLPDVFHSTPLLSRVVCISLLSTTTTTTTTARFESMFSRSAHSRFLRRIFYTNGPLPFLERTNKILRRKKKQKKVVRFIHYLCCARTREHDRDRARTRDRDRAYRDDDDDDTDAVARYKIC